jgi:hypothetical protein
MVTINNQVACAPISTSIEHEKHTGFVVVKQKNQLIPTEVLFGPVGEAHYWRGSTVYLRGECINAPWAKVVYTIKDRSFILVPTSEVVLIDHSTASPDPVPSLPAGLR